MVANGRAPDPVWAQLGAQRVSELRIRLSDNFPELPSEICVQISDLQDLKQAVADRIGDAPATQVWTPIDFLDLGSRDAIDKALQRLVHAGRLRRIDRGLYDAPQVSSLTKRPAVADYRRIIDALGRRDQLRMLVDGLTAANDLGLTTAVPARVIIHTDARRRTIRLDNLTIEFKHTAPSKLYWAGRPAMRIVQALRWLKDTLPADRDRIMAHLAAILADRRHGKALRDDLRAGVATLPAWMQEIVRALLSVHTDRSATPVRRRRVRTVGEKRSGKKTTAVRP